MSYLQMEFLKLLIALIYLFCFQRKVHAKIPPLLSLRHGVSPGAKKLGEVMWPSPPLSFAAPLLRCRDLSCWSFCPLLPYSSSHEVRFAWVAGCIRTPLPIHPNGGPAREGELSSVTWVLSGGRIDREALPRKCSIGQRLVRCGVGLREIKDEGR